MPYPNHPNGSIPGRGSNHPPYPSSGQQQYPGSQPPPGQQQFHESQPPSVQPQYHGSQPPPPQQQYQESQRAPAPHQYHGSLPPLAQQQYHGSQPPLPPPISIPAPTMPPQPAFHQYNMTTSAQPPPQSPSPDSDGSEEKFKNLAPAANISRIHDGKAYILEIVQQPMRARMCGFGDKDRRPISPPPCIRLRIVDVKTHKDIEYANIQNLSRFVLLVDLVEPLELGEKNIVKHSSQSPSISTVTTTSYPPTASSASSNLSLPSYSGPQNGSYTTPNHTQSHPRPPDRQLSMNGTNQPQYYTNGMAHHNQVPQGPYPPHYNSHFPPSFGPSQNQSQMAPPEARGPIDLLRSPQAGTCTRNLIGSLSGSAFKLKDLKGEVGLWFVFQDLSIRTEGYFRLKFSFFDLMNDSIPLNADATTASLAKLAPMLAYTYSDAFHVYSAKKFPGVIESTPLSKEFAKQGIKISIRKDVIKEGQKSGGKRKRDGSNETDDEDDDDDQ